MQTFRDTYRYRHVLFALTARSLKAQYRNMGLGFLWALLNPLVLVTVLSVVFTQFMHAGLDHPSKVVVGLIPFNFFSYCVNGSAGSIVGNAGLVRKVRFPRQILPYSIILTHLVHFAIQSTLIVLVLAVFPQGGPVLGWQLLWLPPIVVLHLGLCVGLGMLVAAWNVVFRDTRYVVQSLLTVLFWMSPVIYDPRTAAFAGDVGWIGRLYYLNPVAAVLDGYRAILFWGRAPDLWTTVLGTLVILALGVLGMRTFWRHERDFGDLL